MQITIELSDMRSETIVGLANGLADEIDAWEAGHDHVLWQQFMACCNELTHRGVDRTAVVRCPE